jgi:hypothetical protein
MNFRAASVLAAIALTMMIDGAGVAQSENLTAVQSDDLDPDAEEIAQVRKEHLAELMKIPHVVGVATELNDRGEVVLDVEVDEPENVSDVERNAPPRVDGFPVDVDVAPHVQTSPNAATDFGSDSTHRSH